MQQELRHAVGLALGEAVKKAHPIAGGDINDAYGVTLATGTQVFVKTNARANKRMFETEAAGLAWLAEAGSLRVPKVLYATSSSTEGPSFLVLELLSPARPCRGFDEKLGRGLAELHRSGAPTFGWTTANFIGRLAQSNTPCKSWADFYRRQRLQPQLQMAHDAGRATTEMRQGFDNLFERLEDSIGPAEPPARVHGDLWVGNLHLDGKGEPCLIDPAVYGGHREMDLAMMRLFGGFSDRCFAAYEEAFPLAPGYRDRTYLYQLYPLMVHVNLFGSSYINSVVGALRRCVSGMNHVAPKSDPQRH